MKKEFNEIIEMLQSLQKFFETIDKLRESEFYEEMMEMPIEVFGAVWCTTIEEYCIKNDMNSKETAEILLWMIQKTYEENGPAKDWVKRDNTYEFGNVKVRFKSAEEDD